MFNKKRKEILHEEYELCKLEANGRDANTGLRQNRYFLVRQKFFTGDPFTPKGH
jgi:hypothetical protein